jgi:hypothetical protein
MPTWSWVSVFGGSVRFVSDPDRVKELMTDVWTTPNCDVKVWLPADREPSPRWAEFDAAWQSSRPAKIIPELGPLIKVESRVGVIKDVTFRPWKGEEFDTWHDNLHKVVISIAGPIYDMYIDCLEELPPHPPDEETTFHNLGWKFILIHRSSLYNPQPEKRDAWANWKPTDVFLVIRPHGQYWKRVGLFKTEDKLYREMTQETVNLV